MSDEDKIAKAIEGLATGSGWTGVNVTFATIGVLIAGAALAVNWYYSHKNFKLQEINQLREERAKRKEFNDKLNELLELSQMMPGGTKPDNKSPRIRRLITYVNRLDKTDKLAFGKYVAECYNSMSPIVQSTYGGSNSDSSNQVSPTTEAIARLHSEGSDEATTLIDLKDVLKAM